MGFLPVAIILAGGVIIFFIERHLEKNEDLPPAHGRKALRSKSPS